MKLKQYNGHRSWNAWNVSLWINNDESLYRYAFDLVKTKGVKKATKTLANELQGMKTPDGAAYNPLCIRLAIEGILD